jgi:hypothetical protein
VAVNAVAAVQTLDAPVVLGDAALELAQLLVEIAKQLHGQGWQRFGAVFEQRR